MNFLIRSLLAASMLTGAISHVLARDIVAKPTGAYATIDVAPTNDAIKKLQHGSHRERRATSDAIEAAPARYAPPALYALSRALFDDGRKDDAAFWFYAAQLRARFDANRCADGSARAAVDALNGEYGAPVNRYMFQRLDALEALVPKVIEWDRATPHEYDARWINRHGMGAFPGGGDAALSLPQDQWETIAERTRDEYLAGFEAAMASMKR